MNETNVIFCNKAINKIIKAYEQKKGTKMTEQQKTSCQFMIDGIYYREGKKGVIKYLEEENIYTKTKEQDINKLKLKPKTIQDKIYYYKEKLRQETLEQHKKMKRFPWGGGFNKNGRNKITISTRKSDILEEKIALLEKQMNLEK